MLRSLVGSEMCIRDRHIPVYRACTFSHPFLIRPIRDLQRASTCVVHVTCLQTNTIPSARLNPKLSPPVLRRRPVSKTPSLQLLDTLLLVVFTQIACVRLPHFEIDQTATCTVSALNHTTDDGYERSGHSPALRLRIPHHVPQPFIARLDAQLSHGSVRRHHIVSSMD